MPRAKSRRPCAEFGEGRHRVWAEAMPAGEDIVIYIGGGEKAHVGSLSLADAGHAPLSASLPGHRDHLVSSRAAARVSKELGKTCVVVAGIHVDNATRPDIELLLNNSDKCLDLLIGMMKKERYQIFTGPTA
jgi:hypothetical protein